MNKNTTLKIKVQNALGRNGHYLIRTIEDKELRKEFTCRYLIFDSNDCLVGQYNSLADILEDYR